MTGTGMAAPGLQAARHFTGKLDFIDMLTRCYGQGRTPLWQPRTRAAAAYSAVATTTGRQCTYFYNPSP